MPAQAGIFVIGRGKQAACAACAGDSKGIAYKRNRALQNIGESPFFSFVFPLFVNGSDIHHFFDHGDILYYPFHLNEKMPKN
jgi:hypothetical protein